MVTCRASVVGPKDMPKKKSKKVTGPRLTHYVIRRGPHVIFTASIADVVLPAVAEPLHAALMGASLDWARHKDPASPVDHLAQDRRLERRDDNEVELDEDDLVVIPTFHGDEDGDAHHHHVRHQISMLCSRLCDSSLEDVIDIAKQETARRASSGNN